MLIKKFILSLKLSNNDYFKNLESINKRLAKDENNYLDLIEKKKNLLIKFTTPCCQEEVTIKFNELEEFLSELDNELLCEKCTHIKAFSWIKNIKIK